MWLVATHLYVPLSLSLTWAMSSFPSFVASAPGGSLGLLARLHSNRMGWEPWARHCTWRESPGWSLTWSGRQVAYGGAVRWRGESFLSRALTKYLNGHYLCLASALSTHSPPPFACTPHYSHGCWLHYRCIVLNLGAPHWSMSKLHWWLCVSMAMALWVWTRWFGEEGSLEGGWSGGEFFLEFKTSREIFRHTHTHTHACKHLTTGLAHHCDGMSLHHCHFPGVHWRQWCSTTPFNRDFNFDLGHPLTVFSLADINSRVIWMDCRPLKKGWQLFHSNWHYGK